MLVIIGMSTNMAEVNQRETSVTEFCFKSVNLLPEELITVKVILKLRLWKQRSFAAANKLNHHVNFRF